MPEQVIDPNYLALQQQLLNRQPPRSQQIPTGPLILSQLISQIGQNFGGGQGGDTSGIRNIINDRNKQAYIDFNIETELLTTQLEQLKEQMKLRAEMKRNYDDEILRGLGIETERERGRKEKGYANINEEGLKQSKEQGPEDLKLKQAQVQSEQMLGAGREQSFRQAAAEAPYELLAKIATAQKAPLEIAEQGYKTDQAKIKRDRDQVELNVFNMANNILAAGDDSSPEQKLFALRIIRNANLENPEDKQLSPVEKAMKYDPIASALGMKMKTESLGPGEFEKFLGIVHNYSKDIPEPARRVMNSTASRIIDNVKQGDATTQRSLRKEVIDEYSEPAYFDAFRSSPELIQEFRDFINGIEEKQLPLSKGKVKLLDEIRENYLIKIKKVQEQPPQIMSPNIGIGPGMSFETSGTKKKEKPPIYKGIPIPPPRASIFPEDN